jgi:hypothetical protein
MVASGKQLLQRAGLAAALLALALTARVSLAAKTDPTAQSAPYAAQSASYAAQSAFADQPYSLPPEKLRKAIVLGVIRPMLSFGAEFGQVAVLWILLASGFAARLSDWASARSKRGWLRALLFAAILVALLFFAVDLTTDAIGHAFSLRYGISIEPWPAWLLDQAKTLVLTICLETPAMALVAEAVLAVVRRRLCPSRVAGDVSAAIGHRSAFQQLRAVGRVPSGAGAATGARGCPDRDQHSAGADVSDEGQ